MNKRRKLKIENRRKLEAWATGVKECYENKCWICGKTEFLNAHHIIPKEFLETRFEVFNGIALCPKHHKFGKYSAHKNPIWLFEKLLYGEPLKLHHLIEKIREIENGNNS